jgi:hypothetical protein
MNLSVKEKQDLVGYRYFKKIGALETLSLHEH